ncbi:hypothetical protein ACZ87_03345, partial [Candidatus Erwinia dacicola]
MPSLHLNLNLNQIKFAIRQKNGRVRQGGVNSDPTFRS